MFRSRIALVPYLVVATLVVAGFLWREADRVPRIGEVRTVGTAAVGGPFSLIDQNGTRRTDTDFRGRYMLIFFGYTHCPDVCPTLLAQIADAYARLGPHKTKVVPIFVTVDPERDDPKVMKIYLAAFDPQFIGLTGDMKDIRRMANAYHVYIKKQPLPGGEYGMDHSSTIYLMGPDGKFVTFYDEDTGADAIAADLRKRI